MVRDNEHTQIFSGLGSVNGRVWMGERRERALYGPSDKVRLTDESLNIERYTVPVGGGGAELGEWFSLAPESCTGGKLKKKRRGGLSRREQGVDGSGRGRCRERDVRAAYEKMSESMDSESQKEKSGRVTFNSYFPQMAAVRVTSRSTHSKDMNKKWNEYGRTGSATHIIMLKQGTVGIRERKKVVRSAEPFREQDGRNAVENARKTAEQQGCRQRERMTCLHGFCYRHVLRGNKVGGWAEPRELSLTSRQELRHRSLDKKLTELGKQEKTHREELNSMIVEL